MVYGQVTMFLLCTLFCLYRPMKIKVAMATKIAEMMEKYMNPNITQKPYKLA